MNDEIKPVKAVSSPPKTSRVKRSTKDEGSDLTLEKLAACVAKIAHFSGSESILDEYGIPRWTPGRKDMHRCGD